MSHAATNWALQQRGLKPATKIVLWHLADCHNGHSGQCNPRQSTLADRCEMSRSTINVHLEKLEVLGLIRRVTAVDPETKKQCPTSYILAFDDPEKTVSENKTRAQDVETKTQDVAEPCLDFGHGPVSGFSTEPCPDFGHSRVRNPDTNNPGREPGIEPIGFSGFWDLVPHKVSKAEAEKFWKLMKPEDRALAIKHVRSFYEWFRKNYPTASPLHPVRYLRNRRWEDVGESQPSANPDQLRKTYEKALQSPSPAVREAARTALDRLEAAQ